MGTTWLPKLSSPGERRMQFSPSSRATAREKASGPYLLSQTDSGERVTPGEERDHPRPRHGPISLHTGNGRAEVRSCRAKRASVLQKGYSPCNCQNEGRSCLPRAKKWAWLQLGAGAMCSSLSLSLSLSLSRMSRCRVWAARGKGLLFSGVSVVAPSARRLILDKAPRGLKPGFSFDKF